MLKELKARVYYFGLDPSDVDRITQRFAELQIPAPLEITPLQGDILLEDIILQGREGAEELMSDERLVLFCGISEKGVQTLMQLIKEIIDPKPIFAMMTEHSLKWTFRELMRHLTAEKEALSGDDG
jgi:hypothetical protein